jgi:hypothetical protein
MRFDDVKRVLTMATLFLAMGVLAAIIFAAPRALDAYQSSQVYNNPVYVESSVSYLSGVKRRYEKSDDYDKEIYAKMAVDRSDNLDSRYLSTRVNKWLGEIKEEHKDYISKKRGNVMTSSQPLLITG